MGWQVKQSDNDSDLPEVDLETGQVKKEEKKDTYKDVLDVFEAVLGKRPLTWTTHKVQRDSAENLLKERGLKSVRNALEFYKEHKDEEYCPQTSTPYDLDFKWTKLFNYKKKNG